MTIRGILFDKDGVIVDFDRTWKPALKSMADKLARGDQALAAHYLSVAGFDAVRDIFLPGSVWAAGNTLDLARVWDSAGDADSQAALVRRIEAHCMTFKPVGLLPAADLQEMFANLKADGYRLGIATNDAEGSALKTVGRFGIAPMLDLVMGYDSVANPKPGADPVHLFCSHCGLNAGQIAVVGDNLHDIDMARAAGAGLAIGVLSGNSSHDELAPHVDHLLDNIAGLRNLLETV